MIKSSNYHNYGIDLLRLFLMFSEVFLHLLVSGIVNSENTGYFSYYFFLRTCVFYVDNAFAMISGYYSNGNTKLEIKKILNSWIRVFFYSFIITIIFNLILHIDNAFEIKELIKSALPVTFNMYWYYSAFFILMFIMPIINSFFFKQNDKESKIALVIIFCVFSIIGTFGYDPFSLKHGMSLMWIVVMYCVGLLSKKTKIFTTVSSKKLMLILIVLIVVSWISKIYIDVNYFVTLTSPAQVLIALIVLILFSRIEVKEKQKRIVGYFGSLAFGVYLFHCNPTVVSIYANKLGFIKFIQPLKGTVILFGMTIIIFATSIIVEMFRDWLFRKMYIKEIIIKINSALEKRILLNKK